MTCTHMMNVSRCLSFTCMRIVELYLCEGMLAVKQQAPNTLALVTALVLLKIGTGVGSAQNS